MRKFTQTMLVLLVSVSTAISADVLYSVSASQLQGNSLYAQTLSETGSVTIKPSLSADALGDTYVLNQCLWSVFVVMETTGVSLQPGKMVCVGPEKEVLETTPVGEVTTFGECVGQNCEQYRVGSNVAVTMSLTAPLEFKRQPRNER